MKILPPPEIFSKIENFLQKNPRGILEILGPTAAGKTEFSIKIAEFLQKKFRKKSEIISVDSRQIFREINISSAKISEKEMRGIPHHGLDLVDPDENFSVFKFKNFGEKKIDEILARGNFPILCGGTMLWLDAVSENYKFAENQQKKSTEKLPPKFPFLKIGIFWPREILYKKINERAKIQFKKGLVAETQKILEKFPRITKSAISSFGFLEICDFLDGKISEKTAIEKNQQRNRNYAKRQLTWWRGRRDIFWADGKNFF